MDPDKTVLEVVQEGVQEVMDVLQEYNEISMKFMEPLSDDEMNSLIERQGELTEKIDHLGGWEIDSKLERAMDALQCPPPDAKVANLSGGERRRVALCRLLLQQPDVLLLDEPTTALDVSMQAQILALLKKLNRETGMSMLLISHNLNVMRKLCSFVAVMNRGLLVETGKTEDVYSNPQDPYTRQLIDAIPTREGRGKWQKN